MAKTQKRTSARKRQKPAVTAAPVPERVKRPRRFILCPTCQTKSKKLRSEMGGLQTRRCQNGHYFEADTWGGFGAHSIRRVERIDRPVLVFGSYLDYIYGRFKDDPTGK